MCPQVALCTKGIPNTVTHKACQYLGPQPIQLLSTIAMCGCLSFVLVLELEQMAARKQQHFNLSTTLLSETACIARVLKVCMGSLCF